jgi:ABC-type multidrug transport system permease subunit
LIAAVAAPHPTGDAERGAMKWILTYSLVSSGAIGAVLVLAWALGGIDTEGISANGIIAIALGTIFTVLVAVGLMVLIFYSNRSGQDDQ